MKIARLGLVVICFFHLAVFDASAQQKTKSKKSVKKTAVQKPQVKKNSSKKTNTPKPVEKPTADKPQLSTTQGEQKVKEIVAFLEYVLNMLGSSTTPTRDKDVLITESYAKIFRDTKVQIEDDLDEDRDVITNKDVVAYLKDVDFFFNDVRFEFTIEEIEEGKAGENTFYKVTTKRNLKGVDTENKTINKTVQRFIEINFNPVDQDLKIVSIYTNEFNEKAALTNWWKSLSYEWQAFFSRKLNLTDSASIHDIKNITSLETLDLSNNKYVQDISPLGELTRLKSLNLSHTQIDDLSPIRNLTDLTEINLSDTRVHDLSPLKYSSNMIKLNINKTEVSDITIVQKMPALQYLDIGNTQISDFTPIITLTQLHFLNAEGSALSDLRVLGRLDLLAELNISATAIRDLVPLQVLKNITALDLDSTAIVDINPLSTLENLKVLNANYTGITDLSPLQKLSHLEKIYCDKTSITKSAADAFMASNPKVLVVYNSEDLKIWWDDLSPAWQDVLRNKAAIGAIPSKEELAKVTNLDSINLAGNIRIDDLEPLRKMQKLQVINISKTPVKDLSPIKDHRDVMTIDISETEINDLSPLNQLTKLKVLKADKSKIESIEALYGLTNLEYFYADNTFVNDINAQEFLEKNPACLLVYKTIHLNRWWRNLSSPWREVFRVQMVKDTVTSRENLHRLAERQVLHIKDAQINDLLPLNEFIRLKELQLSGTAISEIPMLENFKALTSLHIINGPLQNIEALSQLTNLEDLDISNTPIDELKVVGNLTNLKTFNCAGTQIKKLTALEKIQLLEYLDFSNTSVSNLDAIKHLPLKTMKCYNTKVSKREVDGYKKINPTCEIVYYR
jgi:Leucine-rich repeat (LRR) protein